MTVVLETQQLRKKFAGLTATDDVSLKVETGRIHALIGPNGAGKSTLIHQLSGYLRPDSGSVLLDGIDITRLSPAARVRRGIARTFQVTSLLSEWTVTQNIRVAVQSRLGHNMRIFDSLAARYSIAEEVAHILETSPLRARSNVVVEDLSHGERKQLELLVSLASHPKVLLLDEPMAGLGHVESQEMVSFLEGMRGSVTILLVEHDMQAVFALADVISVLVYGRVVMTGTEVEITSSPEVREAYLGSENELC